MPKCTICGKESNNPAKVTMKIFGEKEFYYCSKECAIKSGHSDPVKQAMIEFFNSKCK